MKVTAATGWLTLEVPGVYEIRGDGQRTGTGHEVTTDLVNDDGERISVDVDPDGSTQVGQDLRLSLMTVSELGLTVGMGCGP